MERFRIAPIIEHSQWIMSDFPSSPINTLRFCNGEQVSITSNTLNIAKPALSKHNCSGPDWWNDNVTLPSRVEMFVETNNWPNTHSFSLSDFVWQYQKSEIWWYEVQWIEEMRYRLSSIVLYFILFKIFRWWAAYTLSFRSFPLLQLCAIRITTALSQSEKAFPLLCPSFRELLWNKTRGLSTESSHNLLLELKDGKSMVCIERRELNVYSSVLALISHILTLSDVDRGFPWHFISISDEIESRFVPHFAFWRSTDHLSIQNHSCQRVFSLVLNDYRKTIHPFPKVKLFKSQRVSDVCAIALFLRRCWRSNKVEQCPQDFLIPFIARESHSRKYVHSQSIWIHDGVGSFLPRRFMNLTHVHTRRGN
jgi:hypothetical protein